jgi:hypothetical protein
MALRSASVQSHLSALNSHPRHRDSRPFTGSSSIEKRSQSADARDCSRCSLGPLKDPLLPVSDGSLSRPHIWTNPFRWMLSSYIVISLAFFSASLYRGYSASFFTTPQPTTAPQTHPSALSGINILSPAARLAKLVSLHPPPTHFGPFTYSSEVDPHPHEVTTCLWAHETNLDWVPSWTNRWPGNTLVYGVFLSHIVNRSDVSPRSDPRTSSIGPLFSTPSRFHRSPSPPDA